MKNYNQNKLVITGIGITSAIGQGKAAFTQALMQGQSSFGIMKREGRQKNTSFIGAEISDLCIPESISKRVLRTATFTEQVAMATLNEAWEEARLGEVDAERVGLIVGGSNFQQREIMQIFGSYADKAGFIRPTYGLSFMDSDVCGICTEQFGIKGLAYTVGGASASGQLAVIQAAQAVWTGQVDVCIALGALMDLSYLECYALRSLGAMGSDRYADEPQNACRPFDKNHNGFIYGEACGVVVIERADYAERRGMKPYAAISGFGMVMDANRNPNPSYDGELRAVKIALLQACLKAEDIDYINPHGTGSALGDETELKALKDCGLSHAYINATKSVTGHGLSAAGTVEVIATLLQMRESKLHPTKNLEEPIDPSFNWVKAEAVAHTIKNAISLSMGFGGINTAICLQRYEANNFG